MSSKKATPNDIEPKTHTKADSEFLEETSSYFESSVGTTLQKLQNFAKYVPRQQMTGFLAKYEIFKRVLNVQGSVIECGVHMGKGLMTWAKLSAILEPLNHQRRIFGFDTFAGFPSLSEKDGTGTSTFCVEGGLAAGSYDDLLACIDLYDANRMLGQIPKVELVKGDASETIPHFVETHPHCVVSLLYLDFDLYDPTRAALEAFAPRMPRGSIIAFDELNDEYMPGETIAALETIGIQDLKIERFPFEPKVSFAVL